MSRHPDENRDPEEFIFHGYKNTMVVKNNNRNLKKYFKTLDPGLRRDDAHLICDWQPRPTTLPLLKKKTIHLWRANLDEQSHTTALLSMDEKTRALRFKFPIHQQRFIAARSILRCLLARYLNQPPESFDFKYTEHGKPYLFNQSIYFNISHANQWALYAVSTEEKIGVDIEHIREDTETTSIAQRFFSMHENKIFNQLSSEQKKTAFFRLWTCKEAFIKAVGEGLSFPLKDFDIEIKENTARLLSIKGDKKMAQQWSILEIPAPENYKAALAAKTEITDLKLWNFQYDKMSCRVD